MNQPDWMDGATGLARHGAGYRVPGRGFLYGMTFYRF